MAKKQIKKYVFEPGISKDSSLYPKAVALLLANKAFLQALSTTISLPIPQ